VLTKKQKRIYDFVIKFIDEKDYSPSHEEIGKRFGLSVSTIHEHLENIKQKGFLKKRNKKARSLEPKENGGVLVSIPLLGTIAAGAPIEAIEVPEKIYVPQTDLKRSSKHYALRVKGDSMVEEGIFDGDTVIIREQKTAENGETVVAIIDENEATLKKIYKEKNRIRLQPANPTLFPIFKKEVEVRGVVVEVIRSYKHGIKKSAVKTLGFQRRIDYSWDFRGEKTKSCTHGLHSYPAMFIPQVARRLLRTYSKKNDTVCDIFCGSGTALVESRLLGRNSYGIDLNPLAIFLAKVKTTKLEPMKLTREYFDLINRIEKDNQKDIRIPNFFNLDFWFKKKVIVKLAKIKNSINKIENKDIRNFFLVSFSETVRLASNTKNGEFKLVRIPQEKLEDFDPNVLEIFRKKTESNINGMMDYNKKVNNNVWTKIIYGDSSKNNGIKNNSIDCIVTSPPYGDSKTTVAYGQFSRLSAQWIDIFDDPNEASGVDNQLLGGNVLKETAQNLNSKYLKTVLSEIGKQDHKRARDVLSFFIDLEKCLKRAYGMLKKNKYFCLVIGNRKVKQVRIPTDFIIAELGEKIGFRCKDIFVRNIPGKRMPKQNSPTNITGKLEETMNKESIIILKK